MGCASDIHYNCTCVYVHVQKCMLIKGWAVFAIYTAIVLVCMYMYKNVY